MWAHGLYSPWNCQGQNMEWVTFLFSRGSSQSRDWTQVSHIAGRFFTNWAIREAQLNICVCVSCSFVPDSLQPHGLQSTRVLCPWDFPGKDTGVGCHFLLQGIFPTQGSNQVSCIAGRFFTVWGIKDVNFSRVFYLAETDKLILKFIWKYKQLLL